MPLVPLVPLVRGWYAGMVWQVASDRGRDTVNHALEMKKFVVVVAGNIGAGKSTLVARLSEKLGWMPFYEAVGENPYLADFYRDMPAWSFHSQVFFLARQLRHQLALAQHPASVIQDRCIYEDAEIFAANLRLQGALSERDYAVYRELYVAILQYLPPPDLVIYLRASVEALLARITLRGRDFEQAISREYLARLNDLYEGWIADFTLCPVLTLPTDDLNFVDNEAHLDLIVQKLRDKLAGKEEVVFG